MESVRGKLEEKNNIKESGAPRFPLVAEEILKTLNNDDNIEKFVNDNFHRLEAILIDELDKKGGLVGFNSLGNKLFKTQTDDDRLLLSKIFDRVIEIAIQYSGDHPVVVFGGCCVNKIQYLTKTYYQVTLMSGSNILYNEKAFQTYISINKIELLSGKNEIFSYIELMVNKLLMIGVSGEQILREIFQAQYELMNYDYSGKYEIRNEFISDIHAYIARLKAAISSDINIEEYYILQSIVSVVDNLYANNSDLYHSKTFSIDNYISENIDKMMGIIAGALDKNSIMTYVEMISYMDEATKDIKGLPKIYGDNKLDFLKSACTFGFFFDTQEPISLDAKTIYWISEFDGEKYVFVSKDGKEYFATLEKFSEIEKTIIKLTLPDFSSPQEVEDFVGNNFKMFLKAFSHFSAQIDFLKLGEDYLDFSRICNGVVPKEISVKILNSIIYHLICNTGYQPVNIFGTQKIFHLFIDGRSLFYVIDNYGNQYLMNDLTLNQYCKDNGVMLIVDIDKIFAGLLQMTKNALSSGMSDWDLLRMICEPKITEIFGFQLESRVASINATYNCEMLLIELKKTIKKERGKELLDINYKLILENIWDVLSLFSHSTH